MKRVAILGAGAAGTAAASAAHAAGASVHVYEAGAGASSLTCGAWDDATWEHAQIAKPIDAGVQAFVDALGGVTLGSFRALVASTAGVLRGARGHDDAVLDLAALDGKTIAVPDVRRRTFDGPALAASLGDEPIARAKRLTFVTVDATVLREAREEDVPDPELAELHEAPARIAWLGERLAEARRKTPFDAVLFGPWLGLRSSPAAEIAARIGCPIGEVLSPPGSTAGLRLRARLARLRLVAELPRHRGTATLARAGERFAVTVDGHTETFDAAVLAAGGVLAGGLKYERPDPLAVSSTPRFSVPAWPSATISWERVAARPTLEAALPDLTWARRGGPLEDAGLLHDRLAVLDAADTAVPGLFVAGDLAAARPRTLLEAIAAGLRAGTAAAG